MSDDLSRRDFLGTSGRIAAGGASAWSALHPAIRTARGERADPGETLVVALIGCGEMGNANLADFLRAPEVSVAALCDVDDRRLASTAATFEAKGGRRPRTTRDYREVLDHKDVDAVVIATPDHWHAIPFIAACMAGKDVYVEKPVAHNILEGRAMVHAARRYDRVTQVGTQQRSGEHFRKAVRLVQEGKLGRIGLTRTWNYANRSPAGIGRPADQPHAPEGVDYDRWLGPAPERPFNPARFHHDFRWFFDYAAGMIGNWNVHLQDVIHWAMGVTAPKSVQASGGKYAIDDLGDTPDTMIVTYEYEGPKGPFVQVYEMTRGNAHGPGPAPSADHGMQFHGTDATLLLDRQGYRLVPEGDRAAAISGGGSDQHWPHVQDFLSSVKSRKRCVCDIETGHASTVACHLGNIALKVGRKIHWDAAGEKVVDAHGLPDAEANVLLGREPRKGYELPRIDPPPDAG